MLRLFCFCQGLLSLGFQFLLAKHLAPSFGSGIVTWAFLISATILAYAVGSFLAARIARRGKDRDLKLLVSGTVGSFLLYGGFGSIGLLAAVTFLPFYVGLGLAMLVFAFLPLAGLSCLVPLLLSFDHTLDKTDAGTVYGFSGLGNLTGALLTTFGLMPYLDLLLLRWVWMAGIVVLLVWFSVLVKKRVPWGVYAGALLILPDLLFRPTLNGAVATNHDFYGWSVVVENEGQRHLMNLYAGGLGTESSTVMAEPSKPTDNRVEFFAHLALQAPPQSVLQIGLGGGNLNMAMRQVTPRPELLTLEINPNMVKLATEYFGWRPDAHDRVVNTDGRFYLHQHSAKYDLIVLDAFMGDNAPEQLRTQEFYGQLQRALTPQGYLAINLPSCRKVNAWDLHTITTVFPYVYLQHVSALQSWVYVSMQPHPGWGPNVTTSSLAKSTNPWLLAAGRAGILRDSYNPSPYLQARVSDWARN